MPSGNFLKGNYKMSKTITSQIITRESLINYENTLVLGNKIDWSREKEFGGSPKIGQILQIRRPILTKASWNDMAYGTDANASVTDTYVGLAVAPTLTKCLTFSDEDMALRIDDFKTRYIDKVITVMANTFDQGLADVLSNAGALIKSNSKQVLGADGVLANFDTGVAGSVFETAASGTLTSADIFNAMTILDDMAAPTMDRYGILSPVAMSKLAANQITLFNAQTAISEIYRKGRMGEFNGAEWFKSQVVASHVNGGQGSLVVSAGTITSGWADKATLTVTALTGAVKAGDAFVSTVYSVNPLTKASTSHLQQFTALADAAIGATSVVVSPAPISAGDYQNISGTINSTTLTLVGSTATSYQESYIYQKEAIVAVSPKLYGVSEKVSEETSEETNIRLRFTRDFDAIGARPSAAGFPGWVNRLDVIFGVRVVVPEWVIRLRIRP